MNQYTTVMQQCLHFLPQSRFERIVGQHNADKGVRTFSCVNQLSVMIYAQATGKESLREIETGLKLQSNKWYHLGLTSVAKSTVADANNRRSYKIFEELFYALLEKCQNQIPQRKFQFENPLYSLDGSTIELCLSLFNWARFRRAKGAIKLHTLFNNRTQIPEFLEITTGKTHEVTVAQKKWKEWNLPQGSILAMDRGYIDYHWFNELDDGGIYFVTRAKKNMQYVPIKRSNQLERDVLKDEIIEFVLPEAINAYSKPIRLITFWDKTNQKILRFLTNNFDLTARQIAGVYKDRWQIETFFKWIKQNLKIKTFLGTSENAVLSQIWIAMIYYLILAYIKAQTNIAISAIELARIFSEMFLERVSMIDLFSLTTTSIAKYKKSRTSPQLTLW